MNVVRKLSQFRIGTLNVHFFTDLQGQCNVHHLAQVIKPMSLDALAVQEVLHLTDQSSDAVSENCNNFHLLSDLLQLPYVAFCATEHGFGNAILSRFPLKTTSKYLTESTEKHCIRGMLAVQINHAFFDDNNAKLFVTHLDHLSEEVRLKQMEQFEQHIPDDTSLQLIVGDFNALTFEDYSEDYFKNHIRDKRLRNSWEEPFNLLTNQMKQNGYHDCWREMNKDVRNGEVMTCTHKTRIDYIWKRGDMKNGWKINECKIFPTDNATDHNGVLITFTKS